jgi:hypothetical protein
MSTRMKLAIALAGIAVAGVTTTASGQPRPSARTIEALPRDLEMQLALSALPRHLRENATVYALTPARLASVLLASRSTDRVRA